MTAADHTPRGYVPDTHDLRLGDIRYDARVVNAGAAYLASARDEWAAFLFGDDDLDRRANQHQAGLREIFAARDDHIHRLVTWSGVAGRAVCTCGLVLPSPERVIGPNGHRDQRWERTPTYVALVDDAPAYVAACQDCSARSEPAALDTARTWRTEHACGEPSDSHGDVHDVTAPDHLPTTLDHIRREIGEPLAARSKIVDDGEVIRWITDGRTYRWMVEEYERRYDLRVSPTMFSNFRRRHGLDRRITRDHELIPWETKTEHRHAYPLTMLRFEARRRAGMPLAEAEKRRLESWLRELRELNAVVLYDPDTPDGFYLVPREEGDDDLIRQPHDPRHRTKRPRAD